MAGGTHCRRAPWTGPDPSDPFALDESQLLLEDESVDSSLFP
jgi:hypothetical protein